MSTVETAAKLGSMANQIGRCFEPQRQGEPDHLRKFWDPRMRAAIVAHLDAGGDGLDGPVREAVRRLKETSRS